MKAFLISDNVDTFVGMKVAGIKGIVVHSKEEILFKIEELKEDKEIGIIILTEKISRLVYEEVRELKLKKQGPLIIEIPDRHGTIKGDNSILKYVKESIGLKL